MSIPFSSEAQIPLIAPFTPLTTRHEGRGHGPAPWGHTDTSTRYPRDLSWGFPAGKTSPGTFLARPSLPRGRVCFSREPWRRSRLLPQLRCPRTRAMEGGAAGDPRGLWGDPLTGTFLIPRRVSPGAPLSLDLWDKGGEGFGFGWALGALGALQTPKDHPCTGTCPQRWGFSRSGSQPGWEGGILGKTRGEQPFPSPELPSRFLRATCSSCHQPRPLSLATSPSLVPSPPRHHHCPTSRLPPAVSPLSLPPRWTLN